VRSAAWRHHGAAEGFETLLLQRDGDGCRFEGFSAGVEEGVGWGIAYELAVDERWATRSARVVSHGGRAVLLEADGAGGWLVDGDPAPRLDGCLDADLEGSACTNALPVRRLALDVGERAEVSAAYVRSDLRVERLEQSYTRLEDEGGRQRYEYASPAFDFRAVLVYDEHGLILDYPGIATRVL
jgi:hypothetical protein